MPIDHAIPSINIIMNFVVVVCVCVSEVYIYMFIYFCTK